MKRINKKNGFTLVEMMVAIAVFSIVMVTAMSALLNVIDANNKARAIKTAINNVSFALEGISKDMRMGTDYVCGVSEDTNIPDGVDNVCTSGGGNIIGYKSPRASSGKMAYYRFHGTQIEECLEKEAGTTCSISDFQPITSTEATLTNVKFYVLGVNEDGKQPRMIMTVSGEAGAKEKIKTQFDLQTGVSQRLRPE